MNFFILLTGVLLTGALALTAHADAQTTACACAADFDALTSKIESDYIGYVQRIGPGERAAYESFKHARRQDAVAAETAEACTAALRNWLASFRDGHLFLIEAPPLSAAQSKTLHAALKMSPVSSERAARRRLQARTALDPAEGIWYADDYRVAVLRTDDSHFDAIMLRDELHRFQSGQIKPRLHRIANGNYDVALVSKADYSTKHLQGHIAKGLIFSIAPNYWAKAWPVHARERGLVDTRDPLAPTLLMRRDGTVLISIPSHSPQYAQRLQDIVAANRRALERAPLLILDIRGNEGGSSDTAAALRPYYASPPASRAPYGPHGRFSALSSPDTVALFKEQQKSYRLPRWDRMIDKMQRNPGSIVSDDVSEEDAPEAAPVSAPGKRAVAVLMDRYVMSAGESFVEELRRYRDVTFFGENTRGVLDYVNVGVVALECREDGYLLGYPTAAVSDMLPKDGINGIGFPPDVRIDASDPDPVRRIEQYYSRRQ